MIRPPMAPRQFKLSAVSGARKSCFPTPGADLALLELQQPVAQSAHAPSGTANHREQRASGSAKPSSRQAEGLGQGSPGAVREDEEAADAPSNRRGKVPIPRLCEARGTAATTKGHPRPRRGLEAGAFEFPPGRQVCAATTTRQDATRGVLEPKPVPSGIWFGAVEFC